MSRVYTASGLSFISFVCQAGKAEWLVLILSKYCTSPGGSGRKQRGQFLMSHRGERASAAGLQSHLKHEPRRLPCVGAQRRVNYVAVQCCVSHRLDYVKRLTSGAGGRSYHVAL